VEADGSIGSSIEVDGVHHELATELDYVLGLAYAPMSDAFRAASEGRYEEALVGYQACIARLDPADIEQGVSSPLADIRRVYTAAGM